MKNVVFILRNPKAVNKTLIMLKLFHNGERLKYSTGQQINPEAWNSEENWPSTSKKFQNNQKISLILHQYIQFISKLMVDMELQKTKVTVSLIRKRLNEEFAQFEESIAEDEKPKPTLSEYIETFISECISGERTLKDQKRYSEWTIKGYRTLLYHLNQYSRRPIDFDDITIDFYKDFIKYFNKNNCSPNTIGKSVKNIKVIMYAAQKDKLHNNNAFKEREFATFSENPYNIYLNEEELDRIYELDLSKNEKLERVRDLFIVGARTALRFSDLVDLNENNFYKENDKNIIRVHTKKTDTDVTVAIKKQVLDIFHKYGNKMPRSVSNQKMNEYLKVIGKMAEVNSIVTKKITKGGKSSYETFEKWQLITTHTARRSAATNLFIAGFPAISIMKLTGHKTDMSFQKYIKITSDENAFKMAESDYFTKDYQ